MAAVRKYALVAFTRKQKNGGSQILKYSVVHSSTIRGPLTVYSEVEVLYGAKPYPAILERLSDDQIYLNKLRVEKSGKVAVSTTNVTRSKNARKNVVKEGMHKLLRDGAKADSKMASQVQKEFAEQILGTPPISKKSLIARDNQPSRKMQKLDGSHTTKPFDKSSVGHCTFKPQDDYVMNIGSRQLVVHPLKLPEVDSTEGSLCEADHLSTDNTTENAVLGNSTFQAEEFTVDIKVSPQEQRFIVDVLRNPNCPTASSVTVGSRMPLVKVEQGHRLGSKVLYINDGYYFHINNKKKNTYFLRCLHYYSKRCPARAVCSTDLKGFKRSVNNYHHRGHGPDKSYSSALKLRRNILLKCTKKGPSRFVDIVERESEGFSRRARSSNTAVRLRSAMRRARLRHLPPIPDDLTQLHKILISREYNSLSKTLSGHSLMYAGKCGNAGDQTTCLVFMSNKMRFAARMSKNIFCDSSWEERPDKPQSSQIFCMTTAWDHQVIPLCIALMERKTKNCYKGLFIFIKDIEVLFDPRRINCDFETAQYEALREEFPEARICGCLYHYSKNVCVHARSLGLTRSVQNSHIFSSLVRSVLAIPLLPSDKLLDGLGAVMKRAVDVLFYDKLRPFFEYVHQEYLSKRGHVLSVCGSSDRTSNVSESFNAKLQNTMVDKRPNVYQFISGLLRLEERAHQDIYCMLRGICTGRSQKASAIRNDKVIKRLTRMLQGGHIELITFLRRTSYRLQAPFRQTFPEIIDAESSESDTDEDDHQ